MIIGKYDPLKGEKFRVLDENGAVVNGEPEPRLTEEELIGFYRYMLISRTADTKAFAMQREGRMGTYPPLKGHEALQVGSCMAMEADDWFFPHYRDLGAMLIRGVPIHIVYLYWIGNEEGSRFPDGAHVFPFTVPVGSQIPIGVGHALAGKLRKEKQAVLISFGDGATSEGDFHDGMNFAGVFNAPAVFLCQNNQWAISVPRDRQTASKTIAQKAVAYGFPGIQVDGNDVLAVFSVVKEALDKARAGGGPTLIEAETYRMSDHTTADDASRYRPEDEVKAWEKKDPIIRFRNYLRNKGIWQEELEKSLREEADKIVEEAVRKAENFPHPEPEDIFRFTYKKMPSHLEEELEELKAVLEKRKAD